MLDVPRFSTLKLIPKVGLSQAGEPLLVVAAAEGFVHGVDRLLDLGADVDQVDQVRLLSLVWVLRVLLELD